jgi:hypothetical protein
MMTLSRRLFLALQVWPPLLPSIKFPPFSKVRGLPASAPESAADSGFFDQQFFLHKASFIQHGDRFLGFPAGGHFDKGKATGVAGLVVLQDFYGDDVSGLREKGLKIVFGCLEG